MSTTKRQRWYVGLKNRSRTAFRSTVEPTQITHGTSYTAVIGPFRTKRGALYMRDNSWCETVQRAEKLAAQLVDLAKLGG